MACKGSGVRIPVPPLVGLDPIGWTALMRVQSDFGWTGCLRYGVHFRMSKMGSRVEEHELWTTSIAIVQFVHAQRPKGTAPSCVGSRPLKTAMERSQLNARLETGGLMASEITGLWGVT